MSETPTETSTRGRWSVIAGVAAFGRAALRIALDAALPPLCAACRTPLGGAGGLCPACWAKVSFIAPPYCDRLGIPFPYDPGPGVLSMEAIADPPAYGRARAAVRYDDVAGGLVHHLKYGDRLDLAATMGRWMARAGRDLIEGAEGADALVPVPLHWQRLWGRRFNQAAVPGACHSGDATASGAVRGAATGARHAPAGRAQPQRARRQRPGRLRGDRRRQGRHRRKAAHPDRRRAHLRGDRRYLRAGIAARRRRQCGCAGIRPGCRAGAASHIEDHPLRMIPKSCRLFGQDHA